MPPPSTDEKARYSIGVFDAGGKLVRRLAEAAPESSFSAGMNGFVTRWDLKGDGGKRVPNGRYVLRGVAIPPLKVTGIAAGGGNDWTKDDPALRVARVLDLALTADGSGLFLFRLTDGRAEVACYASTPAGGAEWKLRWHSPVAGRAVAARAEKSAASPESDPWVLAATADLVVLSGGGERFAWRLGDGVPASEATSDAEEAIAQAQTERKATGEEARGAIERRGPAGLLVWQSSADGAGESVRLLKAPATGDEGTEGKPLWSRIFARPAERAEPADAAATLRVELSPSGLDAKRRAAGAAATLRAVTDEKGAHLATAEGLRLRTVSATKGLRAAQLARGESRGKVRFFARGDGGTEEFLVEGCDRLALFQLGACTVGDAGEFTTPGEDEEAKR